MPGPRKPAQARPLRAESAHNVRHDDYGIGATIEHALGIGSFTANDKYGHPVNEAFAGQGANVPATLAARSARPSGSTRRDLAAP